MSSKKKKVIIISSIVGVSASVAGVIVGVLQHKKKHSRAKYTSILSEPPKPKKADLKKYKPE